MIKGIIYIITMVFSLYAIDGINIGKLMKSNRISQIKILILLMSIALSYCVTNFIFDFLSNTSIM